MKLRPEQEGRLYRIALASPETRNALDREACAELLRKLREAAFDPSIGAILLEAEGPVFCAACEPHEELLSIGREILKPFIVAVQGVALGGGLALVANAHIVVAAQGTSFGLTGIREGSWHRAIHQAVAHAIGERRAVELSLSGRVFSTPDALAWGLVHHVAPAFEFDERAEQVATEIANANAETVREMLAK